MMKRSKKNQKVVDAMVKKAVATGYVMDQYANAKKTVDGREYRYKFGVTSYRYEAKIVDRWIRITGAYYKDVKV
jgi:hypothetical protein